jgi:hypothetical protein
MRIVSGDLGLVGWKREKGTNTRTVLLNDIFFLGDVEGNEKVFGSVTWRNDGIQIIFGRLEER